MSSVVTGAFERQEAIFRRWVTAAGGEFPAAAARYHLYVALACPWSHRAVIVRALKGLEDAVGVSYLDPYRDERGWHFNGGRFTDDVNGFEYLAEAYDATDTRYDGRISVPVLWDTETGQIVSNESADIIRMLGTEFDAFARRLRPQPGGLRRRLPQPLRDPRGARRPAGRAPLPRWRPADGGRLAPLPHPRALRPRVLRALPLQRAAARRPPGLTR